MNKKLEDFLKNVDEAMGKADEKLEKVVQPKIKGYSSVLLITLIVMVFAGLSSNSLFMGTIVFVVLASPKLLSMVKEKMKKEEKKGTPDVDDSKKKEDSDEKGQGTK